MKFLTLSEFEEIVKGDDYYRDRWGYFQEAIKILEKESFENVLELGPYKTPIVKGSDTMSIDESKPVSFEASMPDPDYHPRSTYYHDATKIPWPMKDKQYDLFVALQVWEHLEDKQENAFKEVIRVSKSALLSFPFKWNCLGDCHHNITKEKITKWTLGIKPVEIRAVGTRIIYYWKF